jgi:tRNA(fMet)-specific endonuclease VapC
LKPTIPTMFALDTNVCIRLLNGSSERVRERLRTHAHTEIAIASVVRAELLFGARNSQRVSQNLALLERFFAPFGSLPFDDRAAEIYGVLRTDLHRSGALIGPNDLLIAATARAHDAVLVTHNLAEFQRVAGLRVEDWES